MGAWGTAKGGLALELSIWRGWRSGVLTPKGHKGDFSVDKEIGTKINKNQRAGTGLRTAGATDRVGSTLAFRMPLMRSQRKAGYTPPSYDIEFFFQNCCVFGLSMTFAFLRFINTNG